VNGVHDCILSLSITRREHSRVSVHARIDQAIATNW
jgi:hypothetical protein